ncbi:uncharacterized protein AMSG_12169 [Thecamonas trahens ATCC 50062]|uniref:AAA+ ATPase domain-containing protein n=1 Tax=Thecamonas trahens ATCC 50062 TaxID=461836 RepID=A0A0L0DMK7_THETB|nr:hypothetical protein AMSG_12169 [Thecamonas trahens ATCC 50062]KNC52623.1 hypothetical protein AMSG_12169 [Thecamonas trahens ATCC 50062]|eukprot:XP_013755245.1 hypothetical protein AMSG_12169 [Thecamonas trahens ATCC 50062]
MGVWRGRLVKAIGLCLVCNLLGLFFLHRPTPCPSSPQRYATMLTKVELERLPVCAYPSASTSRHVWPMPRSSDKWGRDGPLLLDLLHQLIVQHGLVVIFRRGSLLELYRGFRGDDDLDVYVLMPRGSSLGCFNAMVSAALRELSPLHRERISLASGWPWSWLVRTGFDTPVLWAGRASVDVELLSEDLLLDPAYDARIRAKHGGWRAWDVFAELCVCRHFELGPDIDLLCPAPGAAAEYLALAYGSDFMEPRPGKELDFDLDNRRRLVRNGAASWVFETNYTSNLHVMVDTQSLRFVVKVVATHVENRGKIEATVVAQLPLLAPHWKGLKNKFGAGPKKTGVVKKMSKEYAKEKMPTADVNETIVAVDAPVEMTTSAAEDLILFNLLLRACPELGKEIVEAVESETSGVVEIALDTGAEAELVFVDAIGTTPRGYPSRRKAVIGSLVTTGDLERIDEELQAQSQSGYTTDRRIGIDSTLHRISKAEHVGVPSTMTLRLGRHYAGSSRLLETTVVTGVLGAVNEGKSLSVLLVGRPCSGKTTLLRDLVAELSAELRKGVVVVDTSGEIGGWGTVAHASLGLARRMFVARRERQREVLLETVQNHSPQVVVIDEIRDSGEASAAATTAARGVCVIATAHGNTFADLTANKAQHTLLGGITDVILSSSEAAAAGAARKSTLNRTGTSPFDLIIEVRSFDELAVIANVDAAVDATLAGKPVSKTVYRRRGAPDAPEPQT